MKLSNLSLKLCKFYHQNRRLLKVMMPSWILSALFILIVAICCLAPIKSIGAITFIAVAFLGGLAIIASFYSTYAYIFSHTVYEDNLERLQGLYLNGYPAWEYFDSKVFSRLKYYVGYALCYEAAALEMLAWRGHGSANYIFANVWDGSRKCRHDHSWIEVRHHGIWWVISPAEGDSVSIMPRWIFNLMHFTHYVRIFDSCGFWTSSFINTFYERLSQRETSYLFGELGFFRRDTSNNKMYIDSLCVSRLGDSEEKDAEPGYCFFEEQMPISQEILTQFLAKPERIMPTPRAQKRAKAMTNGLQIARMA